MEDRDRGSMVVGLTEILRVSTQRKDSSLIDLRDRDIVRSSIRDRRSVGIHSSIELADSQADTLSEDVPLVIQTWLDIRPRRD